MLAGVAGGLADHIGVSPLIVRVLFAVTTVFYGFGVLVYVGLWIFVPQRRPDEVLQPAGVAAATRAGKRSGLRRRREDFGQFVALAALTGGVLLVQQSLNTGLSAVVFWPAVLVLAGLGLIWLQVDSSERRRSGSTADQKVPLRRRIGTLARFASGVALVVSGAAIFFAVEGELNIAAESLTAGIVVLLGLLVIIAPWGLRLWRELSAERRERILSQERADVAAHLHDSVLQTLALIQKQADDPRAVTKLARSQERDLRSWLYEGQAAVDESFKAALTRIAAEAEDAHGVPVEVVVVGDTRPDEPVIAVLAAVREAVTNAAKHSGAPLVDVYAEVEDSQIEVFVRDRGVGFDPDAVSTDRMGVRGSIVGRMERYGGKADIRSDAGKGTEVHLTLRRNS